MTEPIVHPAGVVSNFEEPPVVMPGWAQDTRKPLAALAPFVGQSTPASTEIRDLCRFHSPACVDILMDIAEHGRTDAARLAAASAILDRGWGKPVQAIGDPDGSPLGTGLLSRLQGLDLAELRGLALDAEYSVKPAKKRPRKLKTIAD